MKTSELNGAALDWAVLVAEWIGHEFMKEDRFLKIFMHQNRTGQGYCHSRDWAQAGPIIEREGINLDNYGKNPRWSAWTPAPDRESGEAQAYGPTPLIAAMRCFVASKLGAEVEIPEEICQ